MDTLSTDLGKNDAERFIRDEQIDYKPFIAISDLHMVRKTVPLDYESFKKTVTELDDQLWKLIDESASTLAHKHGKEFDLNLYTLGFTEGVAAVWRKFGTTS